KSGLLTGTMTKERVAAFPPDDFRRKALNFLEPRLSRNLELAELMKRIGARHGRTAGEVALAWVLRNPAITAAIVGMRSAAQVQGVVGALEFRLSAEEIAEIDTFRRAASEPRTEESGCCVMRYWSRRLRVGRSSESVFGAVPSGLASTGPFVLPGARRRRGLFGSSGVSTLRRLWSISRRCFTSLNSEVFTTYSGLATRIFWISSWEALMRSSVGGCEEKTLAMVPGFFFSMVWIFSKKSTNAVGS